MRKFITYVIFAMSVITLLIFQDNVGDAIRDALFTCYYTIIPSLFPFMVLSSVFTVLGASVCRTGTYMPFLKIPSVALYSFLMGALCGFPVGVSSTAALTRHGFLTKDEGEILCAAANNTGPGFVVAAVGTTMWGSLYFGVYLYLIQIFTALISSCLISLIFRSKRKNRHDIRHYSSISAEKDSEMPCRIDNKAKNEKALLSSVFITAVGSSAISVIKICGFIVFFSSILSPLITILKSMGASDTLICIISSITEFTSGASTASALGGTAGKFFTGFSIGWAGISVLFQSISAASDSPLTLKKMTLSKIIQGILCGLLATIYPIDHPAVSEVFLEFKNPIPPLPVLLLLILCISVFFVNKSSKKTRDKIKSINFR